MKMVETRKRDFEEEPEPHVITTMIQLHTGRQYIARVLQPMAYTNIV